MDIRQRELEQAANANPGDEAAVQAYLTSALRSGNGREYRAALMKFRPVDFRSLLEREPEREQVPGMGRRYEQFRPLVFGDSGRAISVQASDTHYSDPREWRPTAEGYTRFEVGFLIDGRLSFLPKGCPHREEAESWGYGGFDDEGNEVAFDPEDDGVANHTVYPYLAAERIQEAFAWLFVEFGEAKVAPPRDRTPAGSEVVEQE